jgi:hypothetical protein
MDYEKHFNKIILNQEEVMLKHMLEDCKSKNETILIEDVLTFLLHKNKPINKSKNIKSDIQQRLSKVDEYLFKRPWNKLAPIHKKQKLEEYLQNYLFEATEDNLNEIKSKIMNDFEKKKLNSSKKVNYESISSLIINIEGLKYDTSNCEYSYE